MGSIEDPYPRLMQTSRETWDSLPVAGAPTWYYSTTLPNNPERTVQFPGGTGIYDMGYKDLLAYRWALDSMEWDFMARVNASCYVRKTVLFDHVQTLPTEKLMRGLVAPKGDGTMYMWGGAQFIMSRDVVKAMVDNKHRWQHNEMEDVSMSRLTQELGIPHDSKGRSCSINGRPDGSWICLTYNSTPGFDFRDFAEFKEKAPDQFFIRVKQDGQREKDMWIMRELWRNGLC